MPSSITAASASRPASQLEANWRISLHPAARFCHGGQLGISMHVFYVPQAPRLLRKAAALRRGWQGGGQQRMPSGAAAQAVAEVVEAPCQLFISALSRPHQAYHVTTAVCSGVCRRWHLAALFADEFIDIRCLLALGAAARGHGRGSQAPRGRCAGRLRRKKPIWSRCRQAQ